MSKKTWFGSVTILVVTVLIIWVFRNVIVNQKLATDFLTILYTSDSSRWQRSMDITTTTRDVNRSMEEYHVLYTGFTTSKCYESLISNRMATMTDMWAYENNCTLKAKRVSLKSNFEDSQYRQFIYTVDIQVTSNSDRVQSDIIAEGVLTLERTDDTRYKVSALKMVTTKPYDIHI